MSEKLKVDEADMGMLCVWYSSAEILKYGIPNNKVKINILKAAWHGMSSDPLVGISFTEYTKRLKKLVKKLRKNKNKN